MYDELVAWLRSWSELPAHCECYESCGECDKQDICATFTNERIITKAWEAADAIERLEGELEYTKRQYDLALEDLEKIGWGEWISVEEALPKEFVSVQAHMTDAGLFPSVREAYLAGGKWFFPALNEYHPVDKWTPFSKMPLPEPPKEET